MVGGEDAGVAVVVVGLPDRECVVVEDEAVVGLFTERIRVGIMEME